MGADHTTSIRPMYRSKTKGDKQLMAPPPPPSDVEIIQTNFISPPKKDRLRDAVALFGFSLGLEYHTGNKLKAVIDLALSCGLQREKILFLLGDRLQVYNLAAKDLSLDPDSPEVCDKADALGDQWMRENSEVLQGINLRRWKEFVADPHFLQVKTEFHILYNENTTSGKKFKEGIDSTAATVFERFKRKGAFPDDDRAKALFVRFVLEECALFSCLAKTFNIEYMAYPSAMPSSLDVTKRYIINNDNLLKWLHIKIKTLTASNGDNFKGNGLHRPRADQNPMPATTIKEIEETTDLGKGKEKEKLVEDKDSGFYEMSDTGSSSGSQSSSTSTSPEHSSGSDDDDPSETRVKSFFKNLLFTTADGLEAMGQLTKEKRAKILYEMCQEVSSEIVKSGGHSPPRFFPPPPAQPNPLTAGIKDFN
jgi:hypothetical protein